MSAKNEQLPQDAAEFKFPPEGFEVMGAPEVPEGGTEYKPKEANEHGAFEHAITNADGQEIYRRESSNGSDWQKFHTYDTQGRLIETTFQKPMPGKESQTRDTFEYDEDGRKTTNGKIEVGIDAGHKYNISPTTIEDRGDGKIIETTTTEIIEQGNNGSGTKAEKGTIFTKVAFIKDGAYLGHRTTGTDGTESKSPAPGVEELPNWE